MLCSVCFCFAPLLTCISLRLPGAESRVAPSESARAHGHPPLARAGAERRFMSLPVAERSEAASTRRRRRSATGTLPGRCGAAIRRPSGRRQLASRSVRDVTRDCFNQWGEMCASSFCASGIRPRIPSWQRCSTRRGWPCAACAASQMPSAASSAASRLLALQLHASTLVLGG